MSRYLTLWTGLFFYLGVLTGYGCYCTFTWCVVTVLSLGAVGLCGTGEKTCPKCQIPIHVLTFF